MLHPLMPNTSVDPNPVDLKPGPMYVSNAPHLDLAKALEPAALQAWLEYQFAAHIARTNDLTQSFVRFEKATAEGIKDDAVAGKTTDLIRLTKAEAKAIDGTRVRIKAPVLAASREIDSYAQTWAMPLNGQAKLAESRLAAYYAAKEKAEREERERIAREAEERAAALAAENAPEAEQAFEDAGRAIEEATAPPADLTRVHTARGGVSSLKVSYDFEVTDFEKIPRRFMVVSEALVKVAIREAQKNPDGSPKLEIPGIKIVRVDGVTVR